MLRDGGGSIGRSKNLEIRAADTDSVPQVDAAPVFLDDAVDERAVFAGKVFDPVFAVSQGDARMGAGNHVIRIEIQIRRDGAIGTADHDSGLVDLDCLFGAVV
jgi:hypothetical protein